MTRTFLAVIGALILLPAQRAPAADPPAEVAPPAAPAKAADPAKPAEQAARDVIVAPVEGGYEIEFDVTETPELKEWVKTRLQPACVKWYPIIVKMLPSEGYEAPKKVPVIFRRNGRGVAAASGSRVFCDYPWFSKNLDGEAAGAVVHELVHVVQQYGRARRTEGDAPRRPRNPGWLVEGVADWIRWFNYEPENLRPHPNPQRAKHTDSYRTTAHFLNYVTVKYDKELVKKLNAVMREGKDDEAFWKQDTGKTLEELGAEWKETLGKKSE